MIKNLLGKKKSKFTKPAKELKAQTVPAARFNEMIDYYTQELKSRLKQINDLQEQNRLLVQTAVRQESKSVERAERMQKIQAENLDLKRKLDQK